MDLRRRLPAAVLAVIALALTAVIVSRVSAGADPAPRDTTPIVIAPDASPLDDHDAFRRRQVRQGHPSGA